MLLPREVWKDIPGYEGLYQISNIGNIRSLNYNQTGKVQRLKLDTHKGYKKLCLYKNGRKKSHRVHRLVALAFIPNPNNLPYINHKDENRANNCVWNLEWCTAKYNTNYGTCPQKISTALKGRPCKEETKKKISKTLKNKRLL